MTDNKTFKATVNGIEKEFEVLYTFKSLKTKKDYIIYTDNTYDENNSINIYSSIYYPMDPEKELENIVDDEDWKEVEAFLENVSGDNNE